MEMWFSDIHTDGVKLSILIEEQLFSSQSEVQRIDVLESRDFGEDSGRGRRFDVHRAG